MAGSDSFGHAGQNSIGARPLTEKSSQVPGGLGCVHLGVILRLIKPVRHSDDSGSANGCLSLETEVISNIKNIRVLQLHG